MANDGLVYNRAVKGAATHAVVIGVGRYPHLRDGDGARLADPEDMGQLTSPPVSARAVATWMLDNLACANTARPLGTLRLLVSEAGDSRPFHHSKSNVRSRPLPAPIDNIQSAVEGWKLIGDSSPDHLLIFYFCGHGMGDAGLLALLAEDFGRRPANPLD